MGRIIKFPGSGDGKKKENIGGEEKGQEKVKSIYSQLPFKEKVKKGVEDHILANFAVKTVLGIDLIYRENENREIGVLGAIAYEHKRRAGTFIADFIGKGSVDREGNVNIDTLAFQSGEPELYNSLVKIMKAKKILPELKETE